MRVLERRAGSFAVVLENKNVFEAAVLLEIQNAVAEGPKHVFNALGRQSGQGGIVVGGFNDDLMRAHAIHPVEHALGLAVQTAFNAERRKFVGHHSHRPPRRIPLWRRAAVSVGAISLNFRRSLGLVAVAKGAKTALKFHSIAGKIGRALGAVGRNNDPPAYNWIFSKLRQEMIPFNMKAQSNPLFYATGKALRKTSNCGWRDCPS